MEYPSNFRKIQHDRSQAQKVEFDKGKLDKSN
jgi:hypothetical protein